MRAYYYDNLPGDQREPHDSGRVVDTERLARLGIQHYEFPDDLESVDRIAAEQGYKNRDEIEISPSTLPGYEEKVKNFFNEHLHQDAEVRYITRGGGYFDVRNKDDEWIRIALQAGDLLFLPAGIYHRFTTDSNNYTKAMRLFKEDPKWTPLNRGQDTDANAYRKEYLTTLEGTTA